jgi:hypothetical protein
MSLSVQAAQDTEISHRCELAQRIAGDAKAPRQALRSVFKRVMKGLEERAHTKFEMAMKDRVWNAVSRQKLKTLRETLILEFCEKILGGFSDGEVDAMLEEHKRTGAVKNINHNVQLQTAYLLSKASIIDAVTQKADSMRDAWTPEIVAAVRHQGIELPEPREI